MIDKFLWQRLIFTNMEPVRELKVNGWSRYINEPASIAQLEEWVEMTNEVLPLLKTILPETQVDLSDLPKARPGEEFWDYIARVRSWRHGGQKILARAIKKDPSYFSRIVNGRVTLASDLEAELKSTTGLSHIETDRNGFIAQPKKKKR